MTNETKLYLLTRLDGIQGLFIALAVLAGCGFIFWFIAFCVVQSDAYGDDDKDVARFKKNWNGSKKLAIWLFALGITVAILIPTKNEVILIYAGGKAMDFIETDPSLNKIPAKSTELIYQYIDGKLKELDKAEHTK